VRHNTPHPKELKARHGRPLKRDEVVHETYAPTEEDLIQSVAAQKNVRFGALFSASIIV